MNTLKKLNEHEGGVRAAPVSESAVAEAGDIMSASRRFAGVAAFPIALTFAVALAYWAPRIGIPSEAGIFAVFLASVALVIFLERLIPRDWAWRQQVGRDTWVDGTSLAVMMGVVDPALKTAWPLIAAAVLAWIGYANGVDIFPNAWPFLPKLALAVLVAGFGEYWLHRLSHAWSPMWRFHSVHHSAQRIYWLNGFRTHPLNIAWHQAAGFLILILIGADRATLNGYLSLAVVVSVFQHANARLSLGWLNYIFSTNELHRWHHSTKIDEANSNYGAILSVWDILFGTFRYDPFGRPSRLGLSGNEAYPADSYWKQLWQPFVMPMKIVASTDQSARSLSHKD